MILSTSLAISAWIASVSATSSAQISNAPASVIAVVPPNAQIPAANGASMLQNTTFTPASTLLSNSRDAAPPQGAIDAANDIVTANDILNIPDSLDPSEILKSIGAAAADLIGQATSADPREPKKGGGGRGEGNGGQCPPVWAEVSRDLSKMFVSGGQCNDDARAAIRATFHDCFPEGGCDGSLAMPEELQRRDNTPMAATVTKLARLANKRGVSTADMIAFAGSHAVASCPGGPITPTFVGRKDATQPAPDGQLPAPNNPAADSIEMFRARGLSTTDLAALIGAHTAARVSAKGGTPTDTTPGKWDTLFYQQTIDKTAPITIPSDENLLATRQVGAAMQRFAQDKQGWNNAFSQGMAKMELLGARKSRLVDCTGMLPRAGQKRDMLTAPLLARLR